MIKATPTDSIAGEEDFNELSELLSELEGDMNLEMPDTDMEALNLELSELEGDMNLEMPDMEMPDMEMPDIGIAELELIRHISRN